MSLHSLYKGSSVLMVLIGAALATFTACSNESSFDCRCPSGAFEISVPADRASDVESVTATGACSLASSLGGEQVGLSEDRVGTCHIAVTFKSGAPEYDTDVTLAQGTYECEAVCAPMPTSPVAIPELEGGEGGAL